jgi:hypothetical protein
MNRLIKELHDRACKLDWEQYPNAIPDGERIQQKFAELIVRECMEWCDAHATIDGTAQQIRDDIKKHFGIA